MLHSYNTKMQGNLKKNRKSNVANIIKCSINASITLLICKCPSCSGFASLEQLIMTTMERADKVLNEQNHKMFETFSPYLDISPSQATG